MSARPQIFIVFYSMYGHIHTLAKHIQKGVQKVADVDVTLYQIKETLPQEVLTLMHAPAKPEVPILEPADLVKADAVIFGIPTRFGNMPAQWKSFWDATGQLWASGALNHKLASTFISTASQHGGQETTAFTFITNFAHHGMIYVPLGFTHANLQDNSEVVGGGPWGAGTVAGGDGSRQVSEKEAAIAEHQGESFAKVTKQFFNGRQ
ncbi:hypothetical protein H4R33_003537 [Dimargaris cristalligena]|uniref:NAD(P)H:quinone oxidoreductase, type IV n=1 Tax=Dimargaris cristalligena TaxID=215637 RepID=A0A4P9ZQS6_9FUNG|nr:hypothetical protein H4R33_003537 [Dimargaris cristalligena]RKP35844.1 NAD(P)H:quinone oxidoreductase, type IV [Dimargaris cristalligena]|eukprot:RKP35844.1 NAD(P)H:quinone oxidoreductase, type IV [Dimargaris cristalligena]